MEQKQLFFSIIIPAHNEELYIENTLQHILNLNYPAAKFEAIIIENGSTDKTLEVAKGLENKNITVLSSTEKGVSKARNFGMSKISPNSDWVISLDADTLLKPEFLNDLNNYLQKNQNKNFCIGTSSLMPEPDSRKARWWFAFYDLSHKIFDVSYSIQMVKSSILKNIKFDESMTKGEDLKFIKEAKRYGKFFFLKTPTVYTSTRRFEEVGWWKLLFDWTISANLPYSIQKKMSYKVTR